MNEDLILFFKYAGAALIGLGFIHFVVLRLCSNINNVKRALVSLIVGAIETIVIVIGILADNYRLPFFDNLYYYAFLIVSVLLMIVVPIINFAIGKSRHQQFRNYHIKIVKEKQKEKPTIRDKEEYVYYIFKYNDYVLLKKKVNGGKNYYYGESIKLDKIIFHDEMVNEIINKYKLEEYNEENVISANQIGEALKVGKKDKHYYCYMIEINDLVSALGEFELVSVYELFRYDLEDFDKQIIFNLILREPFKIEI